MRRGGLQPAAVRAARALVAACLPTADTTRGPFYRRDAPWRTRLCPFEEPGRPLLISGRVMVLPDYRPAAGAILDVWQTNARGWYSNMLGLGKPTDPRTFNLRGRMRSDDEGAYRFHTVVPGRYPLFWPLTRPPHTHLIVSHPLCESLTTQIFFEGSKYNQWDPWWDPALTIRLEPDPDDESDRRAHRGCFDIRLTARPI